MTDISDLSWLGETAPEQEQAQDPAAYLEELYSPVTLPTGPAADFAAGQAAAIRGNPTSEEEITRAKYESVSADPRDYAESDYYSMKRTELAEFISQSITNSTQRPAEELASQVEEQAALLQRQALANSKELAYADYVAPNASQGMRENLAVRLAIANDIAQMSEGTSWLSKAGDFLGMLLPGGYTADVYDVPGAVSRTKGLEELAASELTAVVNNFHALPPARKMQLWPLLKQAVLDATGSFGVTDSNRLKAAGILQSMFEPEGADVTKHEANVALGTDIATVIPVAKVATGVTLLSKGKLLSTAGSVMRGALTSTWKNTSAVGLAAGAGDNASAALINSAALKSETVAAGANMTRSTAALNALPMETAKWIDGVTPGLAPDMAVVLNDDAARAAGFVRSMTTESDLLQIGALSKTDRAYQVGNFMKRMEHKGEDLLQEGYTIGELKIIGEDATGFTYQYKLNRVSPLDAKPRYKWDYATNQPVEIKGAQPAEVVHTGVEKWSINSVTGTYSSSAESLAKFDGSTMGVTPDTWAVGGDALDFGRTVTDTARAADLADATRFKLSNFFKWAMEPVGGFTKSRARARVDAVLLHGDEFVNPDTPIRGRVFTKQELAAGFNINGKHIALTSPKEVQAYYRMRMFFDATHRMQDHVLRRELELAGFKSAKFTMRPELIGKEAGEALSFEVIAKPYETAQAAAMSASKRQGYRALDIATGRNELLDGDFIKAQYEKGNVLVRTKGDFSPHGDFAIGKEHVEYVFVPKTAISDLPQQVLHYKPGYVSRINKAQWAVKATLPIIKAGVNNARKTTATRLFNSLQHAEEFRMELASNFAAKHGVSIDEALTHFPAVKIDTLSPMERLEDAVAAHGGLYTGVRSADDMVFGFAGTKPERVSALDTAQRYLSHLSTQFPRNELRLRAEKEWLNTVAEKLPDVKLAGFERTGLPSTPMGKALETMRRQIREWNAIPTRQETLFQAGIQYTHDWLLNGVNRLTGKLGISRMETLPLLWLKHADPIQAVKAANTHILLGAFNIRQIPVQASAAVIAMSRRYGYTLTGSTAGDIAHAFRFAVLDNIRNETALGKVLAKLTKSGEIDGVVADAYRAWTRTGLYESSLGSLEGGVMTTSGMGMTLDTLRSVSDAGLTFWKAGDLFGRRLSFIKEYAYYAAKHPGKAIDDDAILSIVKEVDRDLLQLNSAHRAMWQGGKGTGMMREIAGMMTQYMQVTTHMMELLARPVSRGGFSKMDTFKILAGQTFLFGAAGVPIMTLFAPSIVKSLGIEKMDERTATLINQGVIGGIFSDVLGAHADISQSIAIGAQMNEFLKDMLTSDDPLILRALGPFGSATGSRTLDAMRELDILFTGSRAGEQDLTLDELKMAVASIARIPSSGRNLFKSYMMHQAGEITDRHGNIVIARDFSLPEEMAQAFGMRPTDETTTRFLAMDARTQQELITEAADTRVQLMYDALFVHKLDVEQMRNIRASIQLADEALPEYMQNEVAKRVGKKLFDSPETMQDKAIKHVMDTMVPERLGEEAVYDANGINGMTNPIVVPFAQRLRNLEEDEK